MLISIIQYLNTVCGVQKKCVLKAKSQPWSDESGRDCPLSVCHVLAWAEMPSSPLPTYFQAGKLVLGSGEWENWPGLSPTATLRKMDPVPWPGNTIELSFVRGAGEPVLQTWGQESRAPHVVVWVRERCPPPLPTAADWRTDLRVRRAEKLFLLFTGCGTWKCGPCSLPGQNSRAGSGDVGANEPGPWVVRAELAELLAMLYLVS